MVIVRLVGNHDYEGLLDLARHAPVGLTTLTPDPERLTQRISDSLEGAAPLLVLIDPDTGEIIGTGGFMLGQTTANLTEPFYAYRVERTIFRSKGLGIRTEVQALHLFKSYVSPTEIGTLFIKPSFQGYGFGRLLSLSRFILLSQLASMPNAPVLAEMRGVLDASGRSPFWDAVGNHFFRIDYQAADALSAKDKRFIAELLPSHPIYVPLLPAEAQKVIGAVHPNTQPALRLLEQEGFHFADMIDIFDAGPCMRCDLAAIRTVRDTAEATVTGWVDPHTAASSPEYVVCKGLPFSAMNSQLLIEPDGVQIPRNVASRLHIELGDTVHFALLHPAQQPSSQKNHTRHKETA